MYARRKSFNVETFLKTVNTAAGINQLLLPRVERMALGADINLHLFLCGAGLKCLTAYAANNAFAVLGMDVFLHGVSPLSRMQWRLTQKLIYHMLWINASFFYPFSC